MTDSKSLSYEQARDELTGVVRQLEAGGLTLEQSLDLWERGEKLAAVCAEWLDGARARLSTAMATRDGSPASDDPASKGTASKGTVSGDKPSDRATAPF